MSTIPVLMKEFSLYVFDLDFTLWDCGGTWVDHTDPPFYRRNGLIHDSRGRRLSLYPEVPAILKDLHQKHIPLAVASRSGEPGWAAELMQLFDIQRYFSHIEIYPGSKVVHLNNLREKTGVSFSRMVFFDDEDRNIQDAKRLGVRAVYVPKGLTQNLLV
ncbi:MAG: magnesium-dependent phosphatase-1 [Spirochaetales bacterium]|nr:magnesium-dependent phosphatase-1 [Spirochaetales bacterium]